MGFKTYRGIYNGVYFMCADGSRIKCIPYKGTCYDKGSVYALFFFDGFNWFLLNSISC